MCELVPQVPLVVLYPHNPEYGISFKWHMDFLNDTELLQKRYHPLITYP